MPSGIPYIVANEAAERFSFYGMKAILAVFMTRHLVDSTGAPSPMSEEETKGWFHLFVAASYAFPLMGALVADLLWGKYRTIMTLSCVYCLGHLALALDGTRLGLGIGLALIAIGSGGIKPCVSAHVGDQFGRENKHLLERVFYWFYFSINFGSFFSTLLIPLVLKHHGPHWAFGIPGILMFIAVILFWMGRHKFVHAPVARSTFWTAGSLKTLLRLSTIYGFVCVFWGLYDQTYGAWVLQAEHMDLTFGPWTLLPEQINSVNPILVLLFIPLFSYWLYPAIDRIFPLNALRKIGIGFFLTVVSFLIPAWVEHLIGLGQRPSVYWHILAYAFLTAGEVMVYGTCLEFSYRQAPKAMKSFIMAFMLATVALGNLFTSGVNMVLHYMDKSLLAGPRYYLFFAALMLIAAILYIPVAKRFRESDAQPDA